MVRRRIWTNRIMRISILMRVIHRLSVLTLGIRSPLMAKGAMEGQLLGDCMVRAFVSVFVYQFLSGFPLL